MTGGTDRRSYDQGASSEAQGNIQVVIGQLEHVMAARDAQVKAVMSNFQADGVSDAYHAKELRWQSVSGEVKNIIHLLRTTLEQNDGTAQQTLARAKSAVDNIG